jgi:hypothetical protein
MSEAPENRRRSFQFSVGTMFLALTAVVLCTGGCWGLLRFIQDLRMRK